MTSGDLIIDQSEKMTEILSNELNESNRMPFLHLYIPRSFFLFRCGHFVPHPHGEGVGTATRERVKRCITINHCANAWAQHSTG